MPEKVNLFIEFFSGLFCGDLTWNLQLKDAAVIETPDKADRKSDPASPEGMRRPVRAAANKRGMRFLSREPGWHVCVDLRI
jgi:hypothetical protein